jgi:hypothetical protein
MRKKKPRPACAYHFVDEAGDLSLFNRKKQVVVGNEGVSRFFIMGAAHIEDPEALEQSLAELRTRILSDPLLKGVPSLKPEQRKTAICFHAKDDIPEVRHAVFEMLGSFEIKIFAAVRRKIRLVEQAKDAHRYGGKITDNQIYDDLLKRLLRDRLHIAESNSIVVARRGTRDRKEALVEAIERAKKNFEAKWGEREYGPCEIKTQHPSESSGLQAIDYFLWALQRLYERQEDRFFMAMRSHYRIIMDLDDTRRRKYGEWYSGSNPLTLEKLCS